MSLSGPFIARPIATCLLAVAIFLAGALGYRALPLSALPAVDLPTIQVVTRLPGASADVVSTLITASLERQLGQIPGLLEMTSTSSENTSQITLQFALSRKVDAAALDVQVALNAAAATLPPGLPYAPVYSKVNPADAPILTLALLSDKVTIDRLSDIADTVLKRRLSQVDGVGRVTVQGDIRPAIRVQADPARLAIYGLSLEDVRTAIGNANVNGAKGGFDGPDQATVLSANDQLLSPAAYDQVVIAWRNGSPVRIGDVGGAVTGLENNNVAAWYNGQPAILLDIQRQSGANIVGTVERLNATMKELSPLLPAGIRLVVAGDRTETIRASVRDVQITLFLAMLLVILVILAFLRSWRATLIPALALPLSLIGTFGVMSLCGFALDNLSLMALTVASGFVVDDAIVMIENVVRHIQQGVPPLTAAYRGASQIGFTIVSLTLSLVAVFIPLLFMGGVAGRLFNEFAVTLSAAVIVSAIVSLTLTPMMCGVLLRPAGMTRPGPLGAAAERVFEATLTLYRSSLLWSLRRQRLVLLVALGSVIGTAVLFVAIPKGFLPQQDTGQIVAVTQAAPSASIARVGELQLQAARIVGADPAVSGVAALVGAGLGNAAPNTGRLTITLKPRAERGESGTAIVKRLLAGLGGLPGLSVYMQPVQDIELGTRTTKTEFQYTITDTDSRSASLWGSKLLRAMQALPTLRDVAVDAQEEGFRTVVQVDRMAAMRFGVSMQTVQSVLQDAFGQRQVSTIFTQNNQYRVVLEASSAWRSGADALAGLRVPGTGGAQIPLSAIARFEPVTAPIVISRLDQFPAVTISFNLAEGASLGDATAAIARIRREIGLPPSVSGRYGGAAAEFEKSLPAMPWLIVAAIVVIYIVLGVLYESFIHPITILSTLPSAGIGALLALMIFGLDLSLVALVGVVLLMGIVKKNAIIMIDFAIDAEKNRGLPPRAAIIEACMLRFRPILMTTLAALFGALPLVLLQGAGSEQRLPLGVAITGGLLLSQFLTLYTTPAIYLALQRLRGLATRFASRLAALPR